MTYYSSSIRRQEARYKALQSLVSVLWASSLAILVLVLGWVLIAMILSL